MNVPATPAVNAALLALVIAGAWLTVMVKVFVLLCGLTVLASVTLTVKVTGPFGPVAVPVIVPELLRLKPVGKLPTETV